MLVFINKLDREGKDAFDLLDEVEQKLGLTVVPLSLPIGMGGDFQGIYNIWENNIQLFLEEKKQRVGSAVKFDDINDSKIDEAIGEKAAHRQTLVTNGSRLSIRKNRFSPNKSAFTTKAVVLRADSRFFDDRLTSR